MRVEIRSRRGNIAIGILGVVYALSAAALLFVHLMQTVGAASMTDRAIQILLIGVIVLSIWFVAIAAAGLGLRRARARRATSAAVS